MQIRGARIEADGVGNEARDQRHADRGPRGGRKHDCGPAQIAAQRAEIDAHEGDAEQDEDRMRHIGFEQRTERRHRDADEHQRRKGARALAADPAQQMDGRRDGCLQNRGHSASGREATSRREISKWRYGRDDAATNRRRKVTYGYGVAACSAFDALNR
jgi:hypothetical protein